MSGAAAKALASLAASAGCAAIAWAAPPVAMLVVIALPVSLYVIWRNA
jgi:hypothetical protein